MKKIIAMVLALCTCCFVYSCGEKSKDENEKTISTEVNETVSPQKAPDEAVEEPIEEAISVKEIAIGDKLATDFVEMSFDEIVVAENIKYSITIGNVTTHTGPAPVAGQQYICISGKIKNIAKTELPVYDFFLGSLDLDGYVYSMGATDCDIISGDGSPETTVPPLMEYTFRIYKAIPDSLADSFTGGTFHFGFYDMFDNWTLSKNRAFEDDPVSLCPYQYKLTIK